MKQVPSVKWILSGDTQKHKEPIEETFLSIVPQLKCLQSLLCDNIDTFRMNLRDVEIKRKQLLGAQNQV